MKDGERIDLEGLGLNYVELSDMNDRGQIVGWTVNAGGNFQVLLATPFDSVP